MLVMKFQITGLGNVLKDRLIPYGSMDLYFLSQKQQQQ